MAIKDAFIADQSEWTPSEVQESRLIKKMPERIFAIGMCRPGPDEKFKVIFYLNH